VGTQVLVFYIYSTFTAQFYDGVVLIILMGLLDNYYIPLSEYYSSPVGFDQQVSTEVMKLSVCSRSWEIVSAQCFYAQRIPSHACG